MKHERVKFTWKDHLKGMYSVLMGDSKLNLRMRIKHLNAAGIGDENPMVQVLKRELRRLESVSMQNMKEKQE